jgi:hypothetical protein
MAFSVSRSRYLLPSIAAAIILGVIILVSLYLSQEPIGQEGSDEDLGDNASVSDNEPVVGSKFVLTKLTPAVASRALKGFAKYRERFSQTELYASERIDDLIVNSAHGQAFLRELNSLGFETASEWRSVLVTLDVTFRVIKEFDEDDLVETESAGLSSGVSPKESEPSTWRIHRKVVTDLIENDTNRALLEELVRIE